MGEIYFLNVGCADCTIIKSADTTILVDCAEGISFYSGLLPTDHQIEAVFITHHHNDHFQGLRYLIENNYSIKNLFYSPYVWHEGDNSFRKDEWDDFNFYLEHFRLKGTNTLSLYRQPNFDKACWEIEGMKFYVLEPKRFLVERERELHDGCLVILAELGNRKCLFAGDASDDSLEHATNHRHYTCDDILHASHHGSINGAEARFIRMCNPAYTIISTGPTTHEIPHPAALARYEHYTRIKVYRTDMDGCILATWWLAPSNQPTKTVPVKLLKQ